MWRRVIDVESDRPVSHLPRRRPQMLESRAMGGIVNIASVAGKERQPERLALQRVEGGAHRPHQIARQGTRDEEHSRQRGHARSGEDRDLRFNVAAAHRLYAFKDSDEPLSAPGRSGVADSLARLRRLRIQHRFGI